MNSKKMSVKPVLFCILIFCMLTFCLFHPGTYVQARLLNPIPFTPAVTPISIDALVTPVSLRNIESEHGYSDSLLARIQKISGGDEDFGYGRLIEDPSKYLMWITNEDERQAIVVDEDNTALLGHLDPATGERQNTGFDDLLIERSELLAEYETQTKETERRQDLRMASHAGALLIAGIGASACVVFSGGACIPAVAVAALGAWTNGAREYSEKCHHERILETIKSDLAIIENKIQAHFVYVPDAYGEPFELWRNEDDE